MYSKMQTEFIFGSSDCLLMGYPENTNFETLYIGICFRNAAHLDVLSSVRVIATQNYTINMQ